MASSLITVEPGAGIVADERRAPVRSQHCAAVSLAGCAGVSFVVQLTGPPSAPPSLMRLQVHPSRPARVRVRERLSSCNLLLMFADQLDWTLEQIEKV